MKYKLPLFITGILCLLSFSGCKKMIFLICDTPCPNCPVVGKYFSCRSCCRGHHYVIIGQNFGRFGEGPDDKVTIGGVEANFTGNNSDTQITVEITEETTSGEVVVCSINPGNNYC
jgi:hypothetical protein